MKSIRRIHAWIGVLFAPSLMVFALSGIFQMYGCHEGEGSDEPAGWIVRLAQIHMKQTITAPRKRPPRPAAAAPAPPPAPVAERPPERAAPPTTAPLRLFFALMTIALLASTLLGVYIAFASKRDRKLHVALLVAGVALPIILMML